MKNKEEVFEYKNGTEGVKRFRAHDKGGIKKVFVLKPGKTMESDREVHFGGLEKIEEKTKKGDK